MRNESSGLTACFTCPSFNGYEHPEPGTGSLNIGLNRCTCYGDSQIVYNETDYKAYCPCNTPYHSRSEPLVGNIYCLNCPVYEDDADPNLSWNNDTKTCSCLNGFDRYYDLQLTEAFTCECFQEKYHFEFGANDEHCGVCPVEAARVHNPGLVVDPNAYFDGVGGCKCRPGYRLGFNSTNYYLYCEPFCFGEPLFQTGDGNCYQCSTNTSVGIPIDPNAVYDNATASCTCLNRFSLDTSSGFFGSCSCSQNRGFVADNLCYTCPENPSALTYQNGSCTCNRHYRRDLIPIFEDGVSCVCDGATQLEEGGTCFTCPVEGQGVAVQPNAEWDGTNCNCNSFFTREPNYESGVVDCTCPGNFSFVDSSHTPPICSVCPVNGSSGTVDANAVYFPSFRSCRCGNGYSLKVDNTSGEASCVCEGPSQYESGGKCYTCADAASGVPSVDSNANFTGGVCTCANGHSLSESAETFQARCGCTGTYQYKLNGTCMTCGFGDQGTQFDFRRRQCVCFFGFSLVENTATGEAKCLCNKSSQYIKSGRCFTCATSDSGLSIVDPYARFDAGVCSCNSSSVVLSESTDTLIGTCGCTGNYLFNSGAGGCYTCPVSGSGLTIDPNAIYLPAFRGCYCQGQRRLVLNDALQTASCQCGGTGDFFNSDGNCRTCPVSGSAAAAVDLRARFSSGVCSCASGYRRVESTSGQISCTCSQTYQFLYNATCYDCPDRASLSPYRSYKAWWLPQSSYNPTAACRCVDGYEFSINPSSGQPQCACSGPARFTTNGICHVCPVAGSGRTVDPKASFDAVNEACLCTNGFSLVTSNTDYSVSCQCKGPFLFESGGSCYTCPYPVSNGQCQCYGNQQLLLDSTTKVATCGCDSGSRQFKQRNYCVTCPADRWNFAQKTCDCPAGTVVGRVGSSFACIPCSNYWQFYDNGVCSECAGEPDIRGVHNNMLDGCVCPYGATGIVNRLINTCRRTDSCATGSNTTCANCAGLASTCNWCPATQTCSSSFTAGFDCARTCVVPPSPAPTDCAYSTTCSTCVNRAGCSFISENFMGGRCVPSSSVSSIPNVVKSFTTNQQCTERCDFFSECAECAASSSAFDCEWCTTSSRCQRSSATCRNPLGENELTIKTDNTCNKIGRRFVFSETVSENSVQTNILVRFSFDFHGFGGVNLRRSVVAYVKNVETGAINATLVLSPTAIVPIEITPDRKYQIRYLQTSLGLFAMPKIPYHTVNLELNLEPVGWIPENYVSGQSYRASPQPIYAVQPPPNAVITKSDPEILQVRTAYRGYKIYLEYSGALRTIDAVRVSWAGNAKSVTRTGAVLTFDLTSADTASCSHNFLYIEIDFTDQENRKIYRTISRKMKVYDLTPIKQDTFLGSNMSYTVDGAFVSAYTFVFTNRKSPINPLSWTSGAVEMAITLKAAFQLISTANTAEASIEATGKIVIAERFLIAGGFVGKFNLDNQECQIRIDKLEVGGFIEGGYVWTIRPPLFDKLPKEIRDIIKIEVSVVVGLAAKLQLLPEHKWVPECSWQIGSMKVCPPAEIAPYLRAQATLSIGDNFLGAEVTIQAKFIIKVIFNPKAELGSIAIGLKGEVKGFFCGLEFTLSGQINFCFYAAPDVSCTLEKRSTFEDSDPVFLLSAKNSTQPTHVPVGAAFLASSQEYIYLETYADANSGPRIAFDDSHMAVSIWSVRPASSVRPIPPKIRIATFRGLDSTDLSSVTHTAQDLPLYNSSCVDTVPVISAVPGSPETFVAVWVRSDAASEYDASPLDANGNALLSGISQVKILNSSRIVYAIKYPDPVGWSSLKQFTESRTASAPALSDFRTPHPQVRPMMMAFEYFDAELDGAFFTSSNFGLFSSIWDPATNSFTVEDETPLVSLPGVAKDISITSYHNYHLLLYSFARPDRTQETQFMVLRWADASTSAPEVIVQATPIVADSAIIDSCNETLAKPFSFALSTAAADSSPAEPGNGTLRFVVGFTCQRNNIYLGSVDPFDGSYSVLTDPVVRQGRVSIVSASKTPSGTVLSWHERPELKEILDIEPSYQVVTLNETNGIPSLSSIADTLRQATARFARGTYDETDVQAVLFDGGKKLLATSVERAISPVPILYEDGTEGDQVVAWSVVGSLFDLRNREVDVPIEVSCSSATVRVNGPDAYFDITCLANRDSASVEFTLSIGQFAGAENLLLERKSVAVSSAASFVVTIAIPVSSLSFQNVRVSTNAVGQPFRFNVETSSPQYKIDKESTRIKGVSGNVLVTLGLENAAVVSAPSVVARVYAVSLDGIALGSSGLGQLGFDDAVRTVDVRAGNPKEVELWVRSLYKPGVYSFRIELFASASSSRALDSLDLANVTIFGSAVTPLLPCQVRINTNNNSVTIQNLSNVQKGTILAILNGSSVVSSVDVTGMSSVNVALSGLLNQTLLRFATYSSFGSAPLEYLVDTGAAVALRASSLCPVSVTLLPVGDPVTEVFSFSGKRAVEAVSESYFAVRLGQRPSVGQAVIVTASEPNVTMLLNELGHVPVGSNLLGKTNFALNDGSNRSAVVFVFKKAAADDLMYLSAQAQYLGLASRNITFNAAIVNIVSLQSGSNAALISPGVPSLFVLSALSVVSPASVVFGVDTSASFSSVAVSRTGFVPTERVTVGFDSSVLTPIVSNLTFYSIENTTDSFGNVTTQTILTSALNTSWTYRLASSGVFFFSFFPGAELSISTPIKIVVSGVQTETAPASCPSPAVMVTTTFSPVRGRFAVYASIPDDGSLTNFQLRLGSDTNNVCGFSLQGLESTKYAASSVLRAGTCPGVTYFREVSLPEMSSCFTLSAGINGGSRFAATPTWATATATTVPSTSSIQTSNSSGAEVAFSFEKSRYLASDAFANPVASGNAFESVSILASRVDRDGVISATAEIFILARMKKEYQLSSGASPCVSSNLTADCFQVVRYNHTLPSDICNINTNISIPVTVACRSGVAQCTTSETGSVSISVSFNTLSSSSGGCPLFSVQNTGAVVSTRSSSVSEASVDVLTASPISFSGTFAALGGASVSSVTVRALRATGNGFVIPLVPGLDYDAVSSTDSGVAFHTACANTTNSACFTVRLGASSSFFLMPAGEYQVEFLADVSLLTSEGSFLSSVATSFPTTFSRSGTAGIPSATAPSEGLPVTGLSGGAIAGIVIAVLVVIAAIVAVIAFFLLKRRKTDDVAKRAGSSFRLGYKQHQHEGNSSEESEMQARELPSPRPTTALISADNQATTTDEEPDSAEKSSNNSSSQRKSGKASSVSQSRSSHSASDSPSQSESEGEVSFE